VEGLPNRGKQSQSIDPPWRAAPNRLRRARDSSRTLRGQLSCGSTTHPQKSGGRPTMVIHQPDQAETVSTWFRSG
jgi:hypothetical protein